MRGFVSVLMFGLVTSSYPLSYTDVQQKLKDEFCYGQQRLKDSQEYGFFFDEALFEMERAGLGIPNACSQRHASDLDVQEALSYFKILPVLNIAIYLTYFAGLEGEACVYAQAQFDLLQNKLLVAINKIKTAWQLDDLDPKYELYQAIEFLYVCQILAYLGYVPLDESQILIDLFTSDQFFEKSVAGLYDALQKNKYTIIL